MNELTTMDNYLCVDIDRELSYYQRLCLLRIQRAMRLARRFGSAMRREERVLLSKAITSFAFDAMDAAVMSELTMIVCELEKVEAMP